MSEQRVEQWTIYVCPQCGAIYGSGTDGCWNHGDHNEVSPTPIEVISVSAIAELFGALEKITTETIGPIPPRDREAALDRAWDIAFKAATKFPEAMGK